jgi:ATP/maltotriose-dependent transcriptional regulator MalT
MAASARASRPNTSVKWLSIRSWRSITSRRALPADLKPQLVSLGLSAREADVVELLLVGLSHERVFIAPDTVKKHTYNAHRKLGVQNRVHLSYFVQNRLARRD